MTGRRLSRPRRPRSTGNLTVVGQSRAGYVSLTPDPDADPDTSTINFPLGDTRANGVTVPLSVDRQARRGLQGERRLDRPDLRRHRLLPRRPDRAPLLPAQPGPDHGHPVRHRSPSCSDSSAARSARTLVTGGHFGVPANALAVTGNLTVVGQTKAGYVSITKTPVANPPVSTINFPFGDIRANGVTVPLNAANDMALVYKGSSPAPRPTSSWT